MNGHHPVKIANVFISKSLENGDRLPHANLLKYAYLAQGVSLSRTGKPLINGKIEVWVSGPVFPVIYYHFRYQGMFIKKMSSPLSLNPLRMFSNKLPHLSDTEAGVVDEVYGRYSKMQQTDFTAAYRKMSIPVSKHQLMLYGVLPNDLIREFFDKKLNGAAGCA